MEELIKIRITYYGIEGTIYSEINHYYKNEIDIGDWKKPFEKNSPAVGLEECFIQSDELPLRFQWEQIERIKTEKV